MSTNTQHQDVLTTGPEDVGNKKYLDFWLARLREQFSEDELDGLSSRRLECERAQLEVRFNNLQSRFPHEGYVGDQHMLRIQRGDNYRGLSTLTFDQQQRIVDCKTELYRNLDRAMQDALQREKTETAVSRLGSWLNEFADRLTPIVIWGR